MQSYLDFEKPVADLEGKIAELKSLSGADKAVSIDDEVSALTARAEVLKAGLRIGHVRVDVRDAADRLVATGETTHAVVAVPAPEQPSRG